MADDATEPADRRPPEQTGWNAPPPSATPPPPPPVDTTGAVPVATKAGPSFTLNNPVGLVLGIVAVIGVVLGLLLRSGISGSSVKLWDTMGWAWAILAIAASVTALLPALGGLVGLPAKVAWEVAAIGAGVLTLWWVLFVLPYVQVNTGFLATIGVIAAIGAVWVGKPKDTPEEETL